MIVMTDGLASPLAVREEVVTGEVVGVVFRNEESTFSVMRLMVQGLKDPLTVVGSSLAQVGETVVAKGAWKMHPVHGRQLDAASIATQRPTSGPGMQRYLASGVIKGLGPALAARIVAKFGDETFAMLDESPHRLGEVTGIGRKRVEEIAKVWQESQVERQILVFLADFNIVGALANRIIKRYGATAAQVVEREPYLLSKEVRGIGFATADAIAMRLGIPPTSPERIEAGLRHVIRSSNGMGHCGVPRAQFLETASKMLALDTGMVEPVMNQLLQVRDFMVPVLLLSDSRFIFDKRLYDAEKRIAEALAGMNTAPPWSLTQEQAEGIAADAERAHGVELAPEQREAVVLALCTRVSVLTGGPGTGKTSTLNVVLRALQMARARVQLGAPTGKAAKRMREATGCEASTVARLIGMGREMLGEDVSIDCDILIIDEASMVDVTMLDRVLECLVGSAAIMFVGDVDQLPSVGPGRVLADLIESGAVPTVRLTRIFRQAATSAIVRNAHRINQGREIEPRSEEASDFYFIGCEDPAEIPARIANLVEKHIPDRVGIAAYDVQVLSPMRRGSTGTEALNTLLQERLNSTPEAMIERFGRRYGVGDRVMQTVNNYDLGVMNGESGIIVEIDHAREILRVQVDETAVNYPFGDIDQLDLAYAMTVHKSQGSQFPAVVMPVSTQQFVMLQRPIVYTGITRATKFCVLIGQRRALEMAIRNDRAEPRITSLLMRLAQQA